jgi:hypothetical protein
MTAEHSADLMQTVSLQTLSGVLNRSQALVRIVAKSLDVKVTQEHVTLPDALTLIRYFAGRKSDQDVLWNNQTSKLEAAEARKFELAMALDIVKRERGSLEKQVSLLAAQLDKAHERNDRLEAKLHELTESFAHLVSQRDRLLNRTNVTSKASLKNYQGREVLYLERPVNLHLLGRDHHQSDFG